MRRMVVVVGLHGAERAVRMNEPQRLQNCSRAIWRNAKRIALQRCLIFISLVRKLSDFPAFGGKKEFHFKDRRNRLIFQAILVASACPVVSSPGTLARRLKVISFGRTGGECLEPFYRSGTSKQT